MMNFCLSILNSHDLIGAKCVEILKHNMLFCFHFGSLLPSRIVTVESVLSVEFGVSAVELSKLQGYKMNSVLSSV